MLVHHQKVMQNTVFVVVLKTEVFFRCQNMKMGTRNQPQQYIHTSVCVWDIMK